MRKTFISERSNGGRQVCQSLGRVKRVSVRDQGLAVAWSSGGYESPSRVNRWPLQK